MNQIDYIFPLLILENKKMIYTNNPTKLKKRIENDNNLIYITYRNYIYKVKQLKYSDSNYFCTITYRNNNDDLIEELISDYYCSNYSKI